MVGVTDVTPYLGPAPGSRWFLAAPSVTVETSGRMK